MPAPAPDRALRKLVAELAQATPEDVLGVLDQLPPAHRDEVSALLAAYDGAPAQGVRPQAVEPAVSAGLSPWLAARARGAGGDLAFSMTPTATAALRECVPTPGVQPPSRASAPTPARANGVDTLLARLRGRR
ncbi:hypothetical protein DDF62_22025 [Caulobacter radicis]|uniref:hypothetical protein n=1 Tax=Caulobacter radicis TaxID=2172650 RepID=UPI000D57B3AF|nr:hypothetical protein [Caulobacter radicis]PVM84416.1 hypothetical protein DDF62_22025 [Caulobacter radicis]